MRKKTAVILRSAPCVGGSFGGVKAADEKMNRDACRERRSRTKNWITVGKGRSRLGIGGRPSESEDLERKTND
jgi:hypothetical protein